MHVIIRGPARVTINGETVIVADGEVWIPDPLPAGMRDRFTVTNSHPPEITLDRGALAGFLDAELGQPWTPRLPIDQAIADRRLRLYTVSRDDAHALHAGELEINTATHPADAAIAGYFIPDDLARPVLAKLASATFDPVPTGCTLPETGEWLQLRERRP